MQQSPGTHLAIFARRRLLLALGMRPQAQRTCWRRGVAVQRSRGRLHSAPITGQRPHHCAQGPRCQQSALAAHQGGGHGASGNKRRRGPSKLTASTPGLSRVRAFNKQGTVTRCVASSVFAETCLALWRAGCRAMRADWARGLRARLSSMQKGERATHARTPSPRPCKAA